MYEELTRVREFEIDGVQNWIWPRTDTSTWDIIIDDWVSSHKEKYLRWTKGRDVVVQAGGNCGLYPRLLSNIFGTVYTFEPDPLNFYCLVRNCQVENIVKYQAALGSHHSSIVIHRLTEENVGMHRVSENENGRVMQLKIDDLDLRYCDLICLDVEEYEINALLGATETLKKFKPTVVVENDTAEIRSLLESFEIYPREQSKMDTIYSS